MKIVYFYYAKYLFLLVTIPHTSYKKISTGYFPGGPVVRTLPSNAGDGGSIPGWGAKIPHVPWPKNQNIKQKEYCNKFNKDF